MAGKSRESQRDDMTYFAAIATNLSGKPFSVGTFTNLLYPIIISTKLRLPILTARLCVELYPYLGMIHAAPLGLHQGKTDGGSTAG